MSVPLPMRKPGELELNVKTKDLCVYTLQITANEKIFKEDYKSFTELIRNTALQIHTLCWRANNIVVMGDPYRYRNRLQAQEDAADLCNDMYAMVEIAKPLFHLRSKRVIYWQDKIIGVRNYIRRWHDSDCKRLKPPGV